jgi:hypothetical protein
MVLGKFETIYSMLLFE